MELNIERIEKAIVEEAIEKIISDDDLWSRVKSGIDARINTLWANTVEAKVAEAIESAVSAGFDHAYQKVDQLGRPQGQPTTIAKELDALISNYWTAYVDNQGKPTDSTYNKLTRAQWMMVQICGEKFSETMKQHVVNVGGAVKDHFRKELDKSVNSLLSEVFHVKSIGDQALNNPGRAIIDPTANPL